MFLSNFSKVVKLILKDLAKNDYPVLNTFLFVSCWLGRVMDISLRSFPSYYRADSLEPLPLFQIQEFTYPSILAAKRAIADYLSQPLARLSEPQRAFIDQLLGETLNKKVILSRIRDYFCGTPKGEESAD